MHTKINQIMQYWPLGLFVMVISFSVSMLMTPKELRGGVYTRFMELQAEISVLKDIIVEHDKENQKQIEIYQTMVNSVPDLIKCKRR